jgi:flavin reductase (DIM6/NTAB) family NADH-FMN oxidoreductase RutF
MCNKRKRGNKANQGVGSGTLTETTITQTDDSVVYETNESPPVPCYEKIQSLPFIELTPQSASRLLHPNPVCLLSSLSPTTNQLNVMPISWLTPANNHGGIVFIIHKNRTTAANILEKKEFMLSIPHALQRSMILACGKLSGYKVNKFDGRVPGLKKKSNSSQDAAAAGGGVRKDSQFNMFSVFGQDESEDSGEDEGGGSCETNEIAAAALPPVADEGDTLCPIADTVAHMKCHILQHHEAADPGHWMMSAQIVEAHVHPHYWDGKCFGRTTPNLPPLLSFIGSQKFAFIVEEKDI